MPSVQHHFHPERRNAAHHFQHIIESRPSGLRAMPLPCKNRVTPRTGRIPRHGKSHVGIKKPWRSTRRHNGALRAVGTILRTPSGLDGNQLARLHAIRWMKFPVTWSALEKAGPAKACE